MLSAFKAQPIHELKPKDKSKIESLLGYGDRLLVGLSTGALRVYRVNEEQSSTEEVLENGEPESQAKNRVVELKREIEKFSRKPVQQLAIIKESSLLVSLSDTYVSLHDLREYDLVERLEPTKGATCFAITSNIVQDPDTDIQTLVSKLAVGVKRRILCWTWQSAEQLPEVVDIACESSVKSLVWADGENLVVGMDPGYSMVDINSQKITAVNKPASRVADEKSRELELGGVRFGAVSSSGMGYMGMSSWVPKPMATPLSSGQVLLAKDVNTLFIESDGQALEKRQVPWSLAPEAVAYSYPYLLCLQPTEKATLQIRNPDSLSLLQTIAVPGAMILHVPQPTISLAHAGKGFLVASERTIWRMNALPYYSQLTELVERQRFDEAVSLLKLLEDTLIDNKAWRIREILTQKAIHLFQQQSYRPALDLFTDAETSPDRVIGLYPRSIAGEQPGDPEDNARTNIEANDNDQSTSEKEAPSTPAKSILGFVSSSMRGRSGSDASASVSSPRKKTKQKSHVTSEQGNIEGASLKEAVNCLCSFLAQTRKKIQKYLSIDGTLKQNPPELDNETRKPTFANLLPEAIFSEKDWSETDWEAELLKMAELVDTTLFRSYMLAIPSLAGSLFRLDNFCDPTVVQSSLYESGRYGDLIDFLLGKRLHRQALEMLAKFGKGEAEGEIPEGMRGPERTAGYLKQLPADSIDLILEFAEWPMKENPGVGMGVFLADSENAESLPRDRVRGFLSQIDEKLELQYLEHIVTELKDSTAEFHQRLVDLYLQALGEADITSDNRDSIKTKLESLLTASHSYDKAKTLTQLPDDEPNFYEARAIVLGAMGRHKEALAIYVFKLHDYERAESYCAATYVAQQADAAHELQIGDATYGAQGSKRTGKPFRRQQQQQMDVEATSNIYAVLLGLYLSPPQADEATRWPQALDLLARHGPRLPASSTLPQMPDELGINKLDDYFRGRLRLAMAARRQARMVKALEFVRNKAAERKLLLGEHDEEGVPGGRNRRVRIAEDDHCRVCHRRFGTSAVRVSPDGQVVHYGCVGRMASSSDVNAPTRSRLVTTTTTTPMMRTWT